jgi:hypothetical protein
MVRWYVAEGKQLAEAGVQSTVPPAEPLVNPQIAQTQSA